MKISLSYQNGIEIWIKDQKAVLQIHKATWKAYVVKHFMILFTMKHRQCWLELKKKKKPTFLWLDYRFTQFMKLFWDMNKVLQTTATGDICVIDVSATDDIQDLIREIISKVCV